MSRFTAGVIFYFQTALFWCAYLFSYALFPYFNSKSAIYVGPDNIAGLASRIAKSNAAFQMLLLGSSMFTGYQFLGPSYGRGYRSRLAKLFAGPVLLTVVCRRAHGVIYLGEAGYIAPFHDERRWEFGLLKRRGVKIVTFFTGSDIRSPAISRKASNMLGMEAVVDYVSLAFGSNSSDEIRPRAIAEVADELADIIVNAPVCQASYLKRVDYYFQNFAYVEHVPQLKDFRTGSLRIVHLPSRPLIKGTPVVRAAIFRLRQEGFDFIYDEVIGVSNQIARQRINQSQIVINQLYMPMPGMLGIEAIEAGKVLVTSAFLGADPSIPATERTPWVVANSVNLYDQLRKVLSMSPDELYEIAAASQYWLESNFEGKKTGQRMLSWLS